MIVISLFAAALVLNWAYLVLSTENLQHRTDAIALAAAPELLDEDLLRQHAPNQRDDVQAARYVADNYRQLNNRYTPAALRVPSGGLDVDPGNIDEPNKRLTPGDFHGNMPFNTLRVTARHPSSSGNPAAWLMHWGKSPRAPEVMVRSYAVLDNHFVGFQPSDRVAAPILPLAIDIHAWDNDRVRDRFPHHGNGINEFPGVLRVDRGRGPVNFDGVNMIAISTSGAFNESRMLDQIIDGVLPGDLPLGETILGFSGIAGQEVVLTGRPAISTMLSTQLNNRLHMLKMSEGYVVRAFPVYDREDPKTDISRERVHVIGFVAGAIEFFRRAGNKHILIIEPSFLIHPTARMDMELGRPNLYIHNLHLTR